MRSIAATMGADNQSLDAIYVRSANAGWREWRVAWGQRTGLQQRWAALFREFDVVLCPPMPTVAFPHDAAPVGERRIDIDGKPEPYTSNIVWAALATGPGLPATVAPIERAPGGLPIGVQVIGPYLEDLTPLRFAERLEHAFGGFMPPVF
jgi:amidase